MPYYAVKVGASPGIYEDWPSASRQVRGWRGAVYKKFETYEEAVNYMNSVQVAISVNDTTQYPYDLVVYTDGSLRENGAGWAAYFTNWDGIENIVQHGRVFNDVYFGRTPQNTVRATNQRSELLAILNALFYISLFPISEGFRNVLIKSDSTYAVNCLTSWIQNWISNGWKKSNGYSVDNRDLIETAYNLLNQRRSEGYIINFKMVATKETRGNLVVDHYAAVGGSLQDDLVKLDIVQF